MKFGGPLKFSADREGSKCLIAFRDRSGRGGTLTIHVAGCSTIAAILSSLVNSVDDQTCSFSIEGDFAFLEIQS